ncbi:MAG TPA: efflux RND transporter periplasmic adaptor subunit [Candidatus Sulfotelmatobacter sp.]|nr:efflux RND transporter periplasmic adaptor subunit [Candidatus Sulfotelmatobacter sp.]
MVKVSPGALSRALALCALSACALTACSHAQRAHSTANAVVPVITAADGTVSPVSELSGLIAPLQNVGITSSLSEPTDVITVQEGDLVRKGQVLARLDTADLVAEYNSDMATYNSDIAKADQTYDQAGLTIIQNSNTVDQARAAVRAAQHTLAVDALNLKRDAELLKNGYVAQQTYDQQALTVKNDQETIAQDQVTLANDVKQVQANGSTSTGLQGATVQSARAAAEAALAQAQQVKVSISKAVIYSPIDGVVVNRNLNLGEYPGTRQIFTLQETDRVYAVLNGSGGQIVGIRAGSPVAVESTLLPGKKIYGTTVGVLSPVQPGATNFVVNVVIDNARNLLKPGMVVTGLAQLPSATGVRIPSTAFLDTTNSTVEVVRDGIVHTANVLLVAQDDKNAVVRGLQPGTIVVANGQLGLSDGEPVTVQQTVAEK